MCFDERNTDRRGLPFPACRSLNRVRSRRRRHSASGLFAIGLLLLAFLAADRLVAVLDALALVGLGRAVRADLGRDLTDPLAVGAGDRDRGRPLAGDLDVGRNRVVDVVAVAELQVEAAARNRGAVADAVDLEVAGEAV